MFDLEKLLKLKVDFLTFSDFSGIDTTTKLGQDAYLNQLNDLQNVEKEAESLFNKMNNYRDYIIWIINFLMKDSLSKAQKFYDKRVKEIKNTTPNKYWNTKLQEFELSILKKRNKSKLYFQIFTIIREEMVNYEKDEINQFIADSVCLDISRTISFSNKIIKINDFNSSFENYLLLENMFNIIDVGFHENTKFNLIKYRKKDQFDKILELLISKKIILQSEKETYEWIGKDNYIAGQTDLNHDKYASLSNKKLLLAFGSILKQRGLINENITDKNLSKSLGELFNTNISADYFGEVKREITGSLNSRINNPYINFFDFIPKPV